MDVTMYMGGIALQAVAGAIALQQVHLAPRKLPWLLIAASSLLIVGRRAGTLGEHMAAGSELAEAEMMTLGISGLFLAGVLLMSRVFREATRAQELLRRSQEQINALSGILPICAGCKMIRDDQGRWRRIETYLRDRADNHSSHGLCPTCMDQYLDEVLERKNRAE